MVFVSETYDMPLSQLADPAKSEAEWATNETHR